jgi:hypothetical protein
LEVAELINGIVDDGKAEKRTSFNQEFNFFAFRSEESGASHLSLERRADTKTDLS